MVTSRNDCRFCIERRKRGRCRIADPLGREWAAGGTASASFRPSERAARERSRSRPRDRQPGPSGAAAASRPCIPRLSSRAADQRCRNAPGSRSCGAQGETSDERRIPGAVDSWAHRSDGSCGTITGDDTHRCAGCTCARPWRTPTHPPLGQRWRGASHHICRARHARTGRCGRAPRHRFAARRTSRHHAADQPRLLCRVLWCDHDRSGAGPDLSTAGAKLVTMPEGTFSRMPGLLPFKLGPFSPQHKLAFH